MLGFRQSPRTLFRSAVLWLCALVVIALAVPAWAGTTGAIFTTNYPGCAQINGNIYADAAQVGLNGGPTKNDNLTDGTYYVQVTDPGGTQLGISLGATVTVSAGKFVDCYQLWMLVNQVNDPYGSPSIPGPQGFAATQNGGGEYKVWISRDPFQLGNVSPSTNSDGWKTDNFKTNTYCLPGDITCGAPNPPPSATIYGYKCFDVNLDGTCGNGSTNPPIPNWQILLDNAYANFTNNTGLYQFTVSTNSGPYTASETLPATWLATGCTPNQASCDSSKTSATIDNVYTNNVYGPNFANVCVGAGGGLTLGFWSNQNGQLILTGSKTGNTLNGTAMGALSNESTSTLLKAGLWTGPTDTYSHFRSWLLGATATNMSYMLSAQLATMELNVAFTKVSGSAYVYAPNVVALNSSIPNKLGTFVKISDLISAAVSALDADKNALAGDPNRPYQEALKTALDSANNNLNFAEGSLASCPYSF